MMFYFFRNKLVYPFLWLAKITSFLSKVTKFGAGSTWPGNILLRVFPHSFNKFIDQFSGKIILVVGTNGKTTTVKMISSILGEGKVLTNPSGANLLNGLASALVNNSDWLGKVRGNFGIFEVDEATLPLALVEFTPKIVVCLNLFRDQLDRYGEVDLIAEKWRKAIRTLPKTTTVILNTDDPQIAHLGKDTAAKVLYFGLEDGKLFRKEMEYATDSTFCPECGARLIYEGNFFSHLGHWGCKKCGLKRPKPDLSTYSSPLPGVYIKYNVLAAVLAAKALGISEENIKRGLAKFIPAFGRQEEVIKEGKKVKIILSKNPTGFNQTIDTLRFLPGKKKNVLLVLNDLIPDGRDVSWIWDVDFEKLIPMVENLTISGLRAYDMGVRIKYAMKSQISNIKIFEDLSEAIKKGLKQTNPNETLYILPTYSAMLEVRKLLTGRKIL